MDSKYFSGKYPYIFCDICGQPCYLKDATKLTKETGRGGLMVCKNDTDIVDFGTIPYTIPIEHGPKWVRINHQDTANGSEPYDVEASGVY